MGYAPLLGTESQNGLVSTQAALGSPWTAGTDLSVVLPPMVQPGDLVITVIAWTTAVGTITPPSGYTEIGTQYNKCSFFQHTYSNGDPTTVTFSHPAWTNAGYYCFIVRSDGSPSLSASTGASSSGSSITMESFGVTKETDLRLAFIWQIGSLFRQPAAPAATATDENPVAVGFSPLGGANAVLIQSSNAWINGFLCWNEFTPEDASTASWTLAGGSTTSFGRVITITDGTDLNGATMGDQLLEEQIDGTPNVTAIDNDSSGSGLSAAAGTFGGGADLL